jgi:hypothetical protein
MPDFKYPTVQIEAYNLAEFCTKVQEAFTKGFRFDLESNTNYPTAFGAYYSAGMQLKVEPNKEVTYNTVLDPVPEQEISAQTEAQSQAQTQAQEGATGAEYDLSPKTSTRASKKV